MFDCAAVMQGTALLEVGQKQRMFLEGQVLVVADIGQSLNQLALLAGELALRMIEQIIIQAGGKQLPEIMQRRILVP